jgi:hypothetical protein
MRYPKQPPARKSKDASSGFLVKISGSGSFATHHAGLALFCGAGVSPAGFQTVREQMNPPARRRRHAVAKKHYDDVAAEDFAAR